MMPRRKKKKRYDIKLSRAKNLVRGALATQKSDLASSIVEATTILSESNVEIFLQWIDNYPAKTRRIRPPITSTDYKDLWPTRDSVPVMSSLPLSFKWIKTLLVDNTDHLCRYIQLLNKYEGLVLSNKLEEALIVVETIDKELGYSIWAIETHIALLQRTRGLEAQKKYAEQIREAAPDSLPAFIAHYTSQRNEPNISFTRFTRKLEDTIDGQNVTDHIKKFLTRRILGLKGDNITIEDISHVMCVGGSLSIIDAYEGFVWASQTAVQKGLVEKLTAPVLDCIRALNIDDWRLDKLSAYIGNDFSKIPLRSTDKDLYLLSGNFSEAFQQSMKRLDEVPDDIDSLATASAAAAYGELPDPTLPPYDLHTELIWLLAKVIAKDGGVAQAANDLIKLVLNYRSIRTTPAIYGHLVLEWGEALQFGQGEGTAIFLSSPYLNAFHWQVLSPKASKSLFVNLASRLKNTQIVTLCRSIAEGENLDQVGDQHFPELAQQMLLLLDARGAIYRKDFVNAYRSLTKLQSQDAPIWHRVAAKMELHCLLETNKIDIAIERMVAYCCTEPDARYIFPLKGVLDGLRWKQVRHLRDCIDLPIIFDLYCRTVDEMQHETNRRIAYDEFLLANDCRHPTDLQRISKKFDRDKLIYFLSNVCVQEVMDVSFDVFKNSREIEEGRIAVCQWLTELCPESNDEYSEEIVALTKYINIQDGLRDVDSSRVYVDVDAIGRWAEKELREPFARYKAFVQAGIGFGTPEDFEAALKEFAVGVKHALDDYLFYPNNEGDSLLWDMIEAVTSEYLTNSDYGLDAYLSMRIRHGSLAGFLRGPLEERSLRAYPVNADTHYM